MNALSPSTERLGCLLVKHSLDAIFLTTPDGRILGANPAACELFGYTEAEFIAGGRALISDVSDPEVAALIAERRRHGSVRGEQWMRCKSGRKLRVEVTSALFETQGEQRTAMIVRDLIHPRITEAAAHDLPLACCVADESWRLLWINRAAERITGFGQHELLDKPMPLYSYLEQHDPEKLAAIEQSLKAQGRWSGAVFSQRRSGEVYPLHGTISAVDSVHAGRRHWVVVMADQSAVRDYERRLRAATLYDAVTGLANRVLFGRQAREMLAGSDADAEPLYLAIVDIDGFRDVVESYGHETADRVLARLAGRLRAELPDHGLLARHRGDGFSLLVPGKGGLNAITVTVLKLKKALRVPVHADGHHVALTVSVGISAYPGDGRTPADLLKAAESALRWAKRHGGDGHAFYERGSEGASRRFVELAAPMREGLAKGEFVAYYQPIVDSATRQVVSIETLARWRRADGAIVSPAEFILVAERAGMIGELSEALLRQACAHLRRLDAGGHPGLSIAVNLSARQFGAPHLAQRLLQVIAAEQVAPRRINLEITESVLMDDPRAKSVILRTLQERGVRVIIDDFGTGYSSFAYLKHFQVDGIKLDHVFVNDVPGPSKDEGLMRVMLAVGKELNIPVVAEGVETQAQAAFLHEHGCSLLQGYLISPPLPPDEFATFLDGGTVSGDAAAPRPARFESARPQSGNG